MIKLQRSQKGALERVYKTIKREIYYGYLRPGERLIEEQLAKRLKVGRSSVRIAFQRLAGDGMITHVANKGTKVKKYSVEEIEECYKIQGLLEGFASAVALKFITDDEIKGLKEVQAKLRDKKMVKNVDEYMKLNILFHKVLVTKCNIPMLVSLIKRQKDLIFRYSYILLSIPGQIESNLTHHDEMIKAAERRDLEKMRSIVEKHYWESGKNLGEYFAKIPMLSGNVD